LEYLNVLTKEYFVAELRRKIYSKSNDRKYWKKISGYKKDKIIDISNRNKLHHIFNDETKMNAAYNVFYPLNEIPPIILNQKDLFSYYKKDNDVTITDNGKVLVGRIKEVDLKTAKVEVVLFDSTEHKMFRFNQVRRIL